MFDKNFQFQFNWLSLSLGALLAVDLTIHQNMTEDLIKPSVKLTTKEAPMVPRIFPTLTFLYWCMDCEKQRVPLVD